MRFLFLHSLLPLFIAEIYLFSNANITTKAVSWGNLRVQGHPSDICLNLKVRNKWVYHLGSQNSCQRWQTDDLTSSTSFLDFSFLLGQRIWDFQISADESQISFITSNLANRTYIYSQSWYYTVYLNQTYSEPNQPTQVFPNYPFIYEFYASNSLNNHSTLTKINFATLTAVKKATTAQKYDYIATSPSFTYAVMWSEQSSCLFYSLQKLSNLSSYVPKNTPNTSATSKIFFSSDQSLVVLQTDYFNPVVILSLQNFTVLHEISVTDVIYEAQFLNSSNTFLVVFCEHSTIYVNLLTNEQYSTPGLQTSIFELSQNSLYTCEKNVINKTSIKINVFGNTTISGGTTPKNSSTNQNISTNNSSAHANSTTSPINSSSTTPNSSSTSTSTNSSSALANTSSTTSNSSSTTSNYSSASSGNSSSNSSNPTPPKITPKNTTENSTNSTSSSPEASFYYILELDPGSTSSKALKSINSSL